MSKQPAKKPAATAGGEQPKKTQQPKKSPAQQPASQSPAPASEHVAQSPPKASEPEKKAAAPARGVTQKGPAKAPVEKKAESPAQAAEPEKEQAKGGKAPPKGQQAGRGKAPAVKPAASPSLAPEPEEKKPTPSTTPSKVPEPEQPAAKGKFTGKQVTPRLPKGQAAASPAKEPESTPAEEKKPQPKPAAKVTEETGKTPAPAKPEVAAAKATAPAKAPAKGVEKASGQPTKGAPITDEKSKAPAKKGTEAPTGKAVGGKRKAEETPGGEAQVPVPETLLKKQKKKEESEAKRQKLKIQRKKALKEARKHAFWRAAEYEKEYKNEERKLIRLRRMAKAGSLFYVEPEPKVALVVRIRGILGVSPKVKKILRLLRLRQIHNAVFVKLTGPTIQMLRLVESYVTYGNPTLKTVRDLIYKRGYGKIRGNRIRLTDNAIIANELKNLNILCVEDLIHEIYTCGPHFKYANKFLWPFKLNSPRGGYKKKRVHFTEGGDAGNREKYINKFVRRMN